MIYENLKLEFGAAELGLEFSVFDFDFSEDLEGDWVNVLGRTYREASILEIKVNEKKDDVLNLECVEEAFLEAAFVQDHMSLKMDNSFLSLISRMAFCSFEGKNGEGVNLQKPLGECGFINFDTTALIALVSGISNGSSEKLLATPEAELRDRFKGNYEFVIGQVSFSSRVLCFTHYISK